MLSVIDVMLNVSMNKILQLLPLRPAAAAVLRGEPSSIEIPLTLVRAYEQSHWETCSAICHTLDLPESDLTTLYLDSLRWAHQQIHNFAD